MSVEDQVIAPPDGADASAPAAVAGARELANAPGPLPNDEFRTSSTTRADESSVWAHLAIIIPLALMIFLFRLGVADWRDGCDTHQGKIIAQIMAGDGWVLPLRNGRYLPTKPPLYSWFGALSATLRGSDGDLLDARLPSAVLALAGTLLVYAAARAMAGGAVALWSALIWITTPQVIITGRDSRVDMVFCVFLTAALLLSWYVWEGRGGRYTAALAGLCFGLATLSKGPLALVLGVLVFGVAAVVATPAPGWRLLIAPLPVLLSLGIPAVWYIAATVEHGMEFLRLHFLDENVSRFVTGQDRLPWYYVEPLISMGLPWTIALPAAGAGTSALPSRHRRFLWVWVTVMFVFFSASLGKRRAYLLPLRPALAILLAGWLVPQLVRLRGRERAALPPPAVRALIAGSVLVVLGVALVLSVGLGGWGTAPELWSYWWRLYVREYPGTIVGFTLVIGVGLDQTLRALWQRRMERAAFAFVVTLGVGTAIAISSDAIVRGQALSAQPLARQVAANLAPDEPVAFLDTNDDDDLVNEFQFHFRRHTGVTHSVGDHTSCTPPAPGAYLMLEREWDARRCGADSAWHVIARGGPEVRSHRDQRLVFARYAPTARTLP
jgi:4-amino-4-deoxy-L-arabinose transferase-like glycosyltransferase